MAASRRSARDRRRRKSPGRAPRDLSRHAQNADRWIDAALRTACCVVDVTVSPARMDGRRRGAETRRSPRCSLPLRARARSRFRSDSRASERRRNPDGEEVTRLFRARGADSRRCAPPPTAAARGQRRRSATSSTATSSTPTSASSAADSARSPRASGANLRGALHCRSRKFSGAFGRRGSAARPKSACRAGSTRIHRSDLSRSARGQERRARDAHPCVLPARGVAGSGTRARSPSFCRGCARRARHAAGDSRRDAGRRDPSMICPDKITRPNGSR